MSVENIAKLKEILMKSKSAVFFGGAGVSTESGVKDYRSEDGLYNTVKEYGVSPETILSHDFFFQKPEVFYDFYYKYFLKDTVQPNAAHLALAEWEKRGNLAAVITQNIDGLHQAAGSQKVYELHGTTAEHYCTQCGASFALADLKALGGKVPYCKKCGGIVKPRVVLYQEGLEEQTVVGAIRSIAAADTLIVGGTSLAVYPAAGFLRYFSGEQIILINRDATPLDSKAQLVFRDPIGQVLQKTLETD